MAGLGFWKSTCAVFLFCAATASALPGQIFAVLYTFSGGDDGAYPRAGLVRDSLGNLFGTTNSGGHSNRGVVFELSPTISGGWTYTVLHTFSGEDGSEPYSGLTMDPAGNLYGTTSNGGFRGNGVIFELSPTLVGGWIYSVLYSFKKTSGTFPQGTLALDSVGNLYGTTYDGFIFELSPDSGSWRYSVLYEIKGSGKGSNLVSGVTLDSLGNLFGTTLLGGAYNAGTVFELTPRSGGGWAFKFSSFNGSDGSQPAAPISFDSAGNAFGTTSQGGIHGSGTLFRGILVSGVGWRGTVLHSFTGQSDGGNPESGLTFDADGNFYGTAASSLLGRGTVFEGMPDTQGRWTGRLLHRFSGGVDGSYPNGNLILGTAGEIYGVTQKGGQSNSACANGCGVVFEITP